MTLPDTLVSCLKLAMEHDDLDIEDTVKDAFAIYYSVTGHAFEVEDDEEAEAIVEACFHWVADETLNGLILKGVMEFSSMDENGEVYYGLTEEFRNGNS